MFLVTFHHRYCVYLKCLWSGLKTFVNMIWTANVSFLMLFYYLGIRTYLTLHTTIKTTVLLRQTVSQFTSLVMWCILKAEQSFCLFTHILSLMVEKDLLVYSEAYFFLKNRTHCYIANIKQTRLKPESQHHILLFYIWSGFVSDFTQTAQL